MRATLGSTFEVVEGLIDGKQRRNLTILLYGPGLLVQLWYRVPQIDLTMIFAVSPFINPI